MNDKLNVTVGIIAFTRGTGRIGITRAQAGQALRGTVLRSLRSFTLC